MGSKVIDPVPGQPFKTLTVRLPVDIYAHLASLAQKERRSLHSQMLVLLEQALQPPGEDLNDNDSDTSRR